MNKKITLYELLGLVKDGKAPNKVKVGDNYYEYNRWGNDYTDINMTSNYWLFKDYLFGSNGNRLNDEVEILDDEDKEMKTINGLNNVGNSKDLGEFQDKQQLNNHILKDKINELVREINKLKKEGK